MGKINVTISQEGLHDLISEFKRGNSWAPFQSICQSMMEAGDWNINVTSYVGGDRKLEKPRELIDLLKKAHSAKARNELIKNFGVQKNTPK